MASVVAINAKGRKMVFSEQSWKLLKDKNGWSLLNEQQTENTIKAQAVKLPTGEKPKEQTVSNILNKEESEKEPETTVNTSTVSEEKQKEFLSEIDGLTRRAMMDLLDKHNESAVNKVEYHKKIANDELRLLLATTLDFSTEAFIKLSA